MTSTATTLTARCSDHGQLGQRETPAPSHAGGSTGIVDPTENKESTMTTTTVEQVTQMTAGLALVTTFLHDEIAQLTVEETAARLGEKPEDVRDWLSGGNWPLYELHRFCEDLCLLPASEAMAAAECAVEDTVDGIDAELRAAEGLTQRQIRVLALRCALVMFRNVKADR